MGYTTAQLITAVRSEFGEDTPATSSVDDTQILLFLNQAQREMCAKSNVLLTCSATATQAAKEEYTLPNDCLRVVTVQIIRTDGLKYNLKPMTVNERDPNLQQSSQQTRYYVWGINSGGVNKYYVGLQDIPSATSATDDLHIFYRQAPQTMVNGGVAPEVPEHLQDALVQGALVHIFSRLSTSDTKWLAQMDRKLAIWKDWMIEAKRFVNPLTLDQPIQIRDTALYNYDRR